MNVSPNKHFTRKILSSIHKLKFKLENSVLRTLGCSSYFWNINLTPGSFLSGPQNVKPSATK